MEKGWESMIGSNAYNYINVLDKAANACLTRHELITNNIANVDTPGYKRKDLKFEEYLQKELSGKGTLDQKIERTNLSHLKSSIYTDQKELSYRFDGNNVDIDVENAYMAENQVRYYTLLDSMTQEFSRMRSVLTRS